MTDAHSLWLPLPQEEAPPVAVLVNRAGDILGGSLPAGMPASHLSALLRSPEDAPFGEWWRSLWQAAEAQGLSSALAWLQAADGPEQPVRMRVVRVAARDEAVVLAVPASERQRALIWALHHISLALSWADLDQLLGIVRAHIVALLPATTFYVGLYDQEAEQLVLREAISGGKPAAYLTANPHEGLIGWVLKTRLPLHIRDIAHDVLPAPFVVNDAVPLSHSVLLVPLVAHGEAVGVISVQHVQPYRYTDEDQWLLEAIASQTAVAIHDAYVRAETAARSQMLTFLQNFSFQLAASPRLADVVHVLAEAVVDLAAPDEVRVALRSPGCDRLDETYRYVVGATEPFIQDAQTWIDPVASQVDQEGEAVVLGALTDEAYGLVRSTWPPRALAAYPIQQGSQPLGAMLVLYQEPHLFRQDVRRGLSLIARQASLAVARARYSADLAQRFEQMEALVTLAQQVTGRLDDQDILHLVVHTLRAIFHCRACVVALRLEGSDEVVIRAAAGVKAEWLTAARFTVGQGVAGQVVATGKPIYVADVHAASHPLIFDPEVHSVIAVPIVYQDRLIGSLNLDSTQPNAFFPAHERILTIAAAQIAAALEIARLYQQAQDRAAKLSAANAELQHMEKVREELIQNLSHELRTPLTYVKGYASLLHSQELGPLLPEQREALDIMLEKSDTIERLIHDVVQLEQISPDTLACEGVDFNQLIQQAFQTAQVLHSEAALTFRLDLGTPDCTVYVDRLRFSQALDNLINNAVKFTPAGGQITVCTRVVEPGTEVACSVQDTGIGIPREHLSRIFDRFYQVQDPACTSSRGSGIGLTIVQRVIQAHRGAILVESEPGKGSIFTLTLPCGELPREHP